MNLRCCLHLGPAILSLGLSLLLALAGFTLPTMAEALISPHQAAAVDPEELFRSAYNKRYTWDPGFPGYWVEVSVRYKQDIYHGLATVKPDLSVEVANVNSLTDADNAAVAELIKNQLQMEVIHRRPVPFEQLHGQSRFELEGRDQSGAWQIRELGDAMSSRYNPLPSH